MKTLLALLLTGKLGQIFISAGSMVLAMWGYAMFYGWSFAAGFIGLIFVHEMGHYLAAKQKKLPVGMPTFIPFLGAWIELKEEPMNAETEAYVAFAGPFVGTVGAFICYFWGLEVKSGLLLALAHAGFLINLFNLIPISPLDGGRITAVLSPRIWLLGVPILITVWIMHPSPVLIIIALLALPQLVKAWKFNPNAPEHKSYYEVRPAIRFEYAALYIGLVIVLSSMMYRFSEGIPLT